MPQVHNFYLHLITCFLAYALTVHANNQTNATVPEVSVTLSCNVLYQELAEYISFETGSIDKTSSAHTCDEKMVQVFLSHTFYNKSLYVLSSDSTTIHLTADALTAEKMKEWLVWAFIGRHFVRGEPGNGKNYKYIEYSEDTHTFMRKFVRCEFQKPLYLALILILIVLLIAVLLWDAWQAQRRENDAHKNKESKHAGDGDEKAGLSKNPIGQLGSKLNFRIPYHIEL